MVLVAAAHAGCAPSSSAPEEPAGRLVYSGDPVAQSNVGSLHVVEVQGSNPRKVTAGPVTTTESDPAWSPDGSRIAFARFYDCAAPLGVCSALWVVDAQSGTEERRTQEDAQAVVSALRPAWSTDGTRIAYERYDGRSDASDVWVMNADGSEGRRLTHVGDAAGPTWAPDGRRIALSSAFDIYVVDVETGAVERLTRTPAVDESAPDWSPDGDWIAFNGASAGSGVLDESDVYVMSADGADVAQLSRRGEYDAGPVWSPDGSFIAYGSTPSSGVGLAIVIVDAETGRRIQRLPAPGMVDYGIDWAEE